jgi:DNA topoisomerase IB
LPPAICRASYVHPAVVTAFESGALREFADAPRRARSDKPVQEAVGVVLLEAVAEAA